MISEELDRQIRAEVAERQRLNPPPPLTDEQVLTLRRLFGVRGHLVPRQRESAEAA